MFVEKLVSFETMVVTMVCGSRIVVVSVIAEMIVSSEVMLVLVVRSEQSLECFRPMPEMFSAR